MLRKWVLSDIIDYTSSFIEEMFLLQLLKEAAPDLAILLKLKVWIQADNMGFSEVQSYRFDKRRTMSV